MFYRTTTDIDLLDEMADMIADLNSTFSHYRPDLAIVVTWERVEPMVLTLVRKTLHILYTAKLVL